MRFHKTFSFFGSRAGGSRPPGKLVNQLVCEEPTTVGRWVAVEEER